MTSSVHVNNSKKDISIPSKALIQGLDNTTMFAEKYKDDFQIELMKL